MVQTVPQTAKLKVFISYSRDDSDFANELERGLKLLGYSAFIDRQLSGGEVWKRSIVHHIAQADTVVFVLSPSSARSDMCHWEVDEATKLSKRILPVVARDIADDPVPEKLQQLNYIYFTSGYSFTKGLEELKSSLDKNLDWIREHTRYTDMAQRWSTGQRDPSHLLVGTSLVDAKAWEKSWVRPNPEPTPNIRAFIAASEEAETIRLGKERQRAEQLLRAVGRMRWALAGAVLFAVAASGTAYWAMLQQDKAQLSAKRAEIAGAKAESARKLIESQARKVAGEVVDVFPKALDTVSLAAMTNILEAVVHHLSEAQAGSICERVIKAIPDSTDPEKVSRMSGILKAVERRLSPEQRKTVVEKVVHNILETEESSHIRTMGPLLEAFSSDLTPALIIRIQRRLQREGIYSVYSDGTLGPATMRSIRRWIAGQDDR